MSLNTQYTIFFKKKKKKKNFTFNEIFVNTVNTF